MHEQTLRDATIRFLADLCEPVGPFIFAGYGGPIARLRHQIHQEHADSDTRGFFAAERKVREIRRAWADDAAMPAALDVLLDLYVAPPPEAGRDLTEWLYELTLLLHLCGQRDPAALASRLAARGEAVATLVEDLKELSAEDESPAP